MSETVELIPELEGKRILFFAPPFFGYYKDIIAEFKKNNALVTYYNERPSTNTFIKAAIRINRNLITSLIRRYYKKIISKEKNNHFDYLFVVDPETIDSLIIKKLRGTFLHAQFYAYCWDSVRNKKNYLRVFNKFDRVFSFDKKDTKEHGQVQFLPLFYGPDFYKKSRKQTDKDYDICMIATGHSDRAMLVKHIEQWANEHSLRVFSYVYLPGILLFVYNKIKNLSFKGFSLSDFKYKPMTRSQIVDYMSRSKVVLDIQHPNQNGLTMRCIECLGMSCKQLTTNTDIVNYDFYNSKNIHILDRATLRIDKEFIESHYEDLPKSIVENYSLHSWIRSIFQKNRD